MDAVEKCIHALTTAKFTFEQAVPIVPNDPGIYALHGSPETWARLGIGPPPDDRPLYVGKSEKSLRQRPLGQHFGHRIRVGSRTTSMTGSLAALLADELGLSPCPRNVHKPGYFDRFGLEDDGDAKLTNWMRANLSTSFWKSDGITSLAVLEEKVCQRLMPPLNCEIATTWCDVVIRARKQMSNATRAWCAR